MREPKSQTKAQATKRTPKPRPPVRAETRIRPRKSAGTAPAAPAAEPGVTTLVVLCGLSVLLLTGWLWSLHVIVGDLTATPRSVAAPVALVMPVLVAASLVTGGAAGLAMIAALAHGVRVIRVLPSRLAAGAVGGFGVGAAVATATMLAEGHLPAIATVLAGTVGAGAVIGGCLAALRPAAAVAAGLAATLGVFVIRIVQGLYASPLSRLFGDEDTLAEVARAGIRVALAVSLAAGVVAGVIAHVMLRRTGDGIGLFGHMAAGAAPGLLILVAELVNRIGGARLIAVVGGLNNLDTVNVQFAEGQRFNGALVVLFAGAITSVVLFGRGAQARSRRTTPARGPRPRRR